MPVPVSDANAAAAVLQAAAPERVGITLTNGRRLDIGFSIDEPLALGCGEGGDDAGSGRVFRRMAVRDERAHLDRIDGGWPCRCCS